MTAQSLEGGQGVGGQGLAGAQRGESARQGGVQAKHILLQAGLGGPLPGQALPQSHSLTKWTGFQCGLDYCLVDC